MMKSITLSFAILVLSNNFAFGQKTVTALMILENNYPKVQWITRSQIKGDFDYDGTTDYALRGRKNRKFVLGIIKGKLDAHSKHWILEFPEDAGDQDGLCSIETAVITTDYIDSDYVNFAGDYLAPQYIKRLRRVPKNSKGIIISDGQCDPFHVFWDKKHRRFTWWRV